LLNSQFYDFIAETEKAPSCLLMYGGAQELPLYIRVAVCHLKMCFQGFTDCIQGGINRVDEPFGRLLDSNIRIFEAVAG